MTSARSLRIGFVATRFAGTDGVSLEAEKWADVLREMGHDVYYFGGIVDRAAEHRREVTEAFFGHPDVVAINEALFGTVGTGLGRDQAVDRRIDELATHLAEQLRAFVSDFSLDLLVPENALAIPMHLPLGLAITRVAAETGMPVLAHHHDLPWERQRFLANAATDIISLAFPPALPSVRHVCINSGQQEQIARRLGRTARVIPNVMDFQMPPPEADEVTAGIGADLGLASDELFVLAPVRVVPRKGLEHALQLLARLGRPARLVISHASGDEGLAYAQHLRDLAQLLDVSIVWADDRVADTRGQLPDGRRTYTLGDMYAAADLVTYPSLIEGFGNALLETAYHRRPIFVNRYAAYDTDIRPLGFKGVEMNGFVTEEEVQATRALLEDPERVRSWADTNYRLGLARFSYEAVRRGLRAELGEMFAEAG